MNNWKVTTIVLGVLLVISVFANGFPFTGFLVKNSHVQSAVEFLNENLLDDGMEAEIIDVSEESGLYVVKLDIGGRIFNSYITKDGKLLFPSAIDLTGDVDVIDPQTQSQTPTQYSEEDLEKIRDFVKCLDKKDFKIYGANWCGWTKKLVVETFGGFDVVEPIYVECTEEEETCAKEGVRGYPTVKINGELYQGPRTFEGFAGITNCEAPNVGVQSTSDTEASCN